MNPLYQMLNRPSMNPQTQNMMRQFNAFRQSFHGNAQQQIQQMLNSGRITQEQYNQAVQQAQQFMNMMNNR